MIERTCWYCEASIPVGSFGMCTLCKIRECPLTNNPIRVPTLSIN